MEEITFLRVIFDRRLSFVPYLKYVIKKGLNVLNILNVIGNTEREDERKVMLCLYRYLVSYLHVLDPVHNQGLRLCLGAGARCSSVVRAFAHDAMGRRIDPS